MYPEIYNPCKNKPGGRIKNPFREDRFRCIHCGAEVYTLPMLSGVQNRNHCPYCLSSRHVDHLQAGDRLSACKAIMQPVGLAMKPGRNKYRSQATGELMVIHRCSECGKLSINRLAADDRADRLMDIYHRSAGAEISLLRQLELDGIRMLTGEDLWLVKGQLADCCQG